MRKLTVILLLTTAAILLNNCRTEGNKTSQSKQEDIIKSVIIALNTKNKEDINYIVDSIKYTDWETEQVYKVDYKKSLAVVSRNKIIVYYDAESFISGKPTSFVSLEKSSNPPEDTTVIKSPSTGNLYINIGGIAYSTENNNPLLNVYNITYHDYKNKYSSITLTLVITESGKPRMEQLYCRTFTGNSE